MEVHPNSINTSISYEESAGMPTLVQADDITFESILEASTIEIQSLFDVANKDAFEYSSWSRITSQEAAEEFIDERVEKWEDGTRFSYIVRCNDVTVGCMYAKYDACKSSDVVIVGLWLHPEVWGNNLAGRCNDILFHLLFTELQVNRIRIECLVPHHQSRRTIEKTVERYGGSYYGTAVWNAEEYEDWDDQYIPFHQYVITDADWKRCERGIGCTIPNMEYSMFDFG